MKINRIAFALFLMAASAFGQGGGTIHGNGDPRTLTPTPNCAASRFFVDDSTQLLYIAASGSPCVWSPGNGASSVNLAPNMANWNVSPNCGSQANCTQIYGDTKYVVDATSNSTTTVTCPDCAFTSADVGKVAWATTQGSGPGIGYLLYTTFVCPQTTIASVTNATTIVLNNACTASGSGNVALIWGHDDGAALASLDAAVGCAVVHLATANTFIMDSQPFFVHAPSAALCNTQLSLSTGAVAPYLMGDGFGASQAVIVLTPNFNWAGAATISGTRPGYAVAIGGYARGIANIQIWGTGLTSASNANCANALNRIVVSAYPPSSVLYGVDIGGICPGQANLIGVEMNSFDENWDLGGAQSVGTIACEAYGQKGMVMRENDCRNDNIASGFGLQVTGGAQLYSISSYPLVGISVTAAGSSFQSYMSTIQNGNGVPSIQCATGTSYYSYADTVGTITIDSGCQHFTEGSNYTGTFTNNGVTNSLGGGNKYGSIPSGTGAFVGTNVFFGKCNGVATASSTLGLYGLGQFTTPACTSTTVVAGVAIQQVPLSGSVNSLRCASTAAGVNASSGVVTVLKNGSATTLTCTFGTTTSCTDTSHFDVPVIGDVYSIQFTTQTAETLAGVRCSLLNW